MAHTYSSLSKSMQENQVCPRHKRCSWEETTRLQIFENVKFDVKEWRKHKKSATQPICSVSSRKKASYRKNKIKQLG
ncbi:hypothetical protein E2986_11227 [Frieseomelitta varia]|uniref:Uncharacterized protein n=1 Tax=Frieseomelitta varia TaxID=561572 RepID=A0A833VUG8_9HYME|nr:hypothetical protein E2986_11227 [Frieseomelitta varia]